MIDRALKAERQRRYLANLTPAHKVERAEKQRAYQRRYRATTKGRAVKVASDRLRLYGLTSKQFDVMFAAQDGKCAVCQDRLAEHIDHCHVTGRVRGILCSTCNTGIGKLGDDVDGILRALNYLLAWEEDHA